MVLVEFSHIDKNALLDMMDGFGYDNPFNLREDMLFVKRGPWRCISLASYPLFNIIIIIFIYIINLNFILSLLQGDMRFKGLSHKLISISQISYFWYLWRVVLLTLVGGVHKPLKLGHVGPAFCSQGPWMAAQHGIDPSD